MNTNEVNIENLGEKNEVNINVSVLQFFWKKKGEHRLDERRGPRAI